MYSIQSLYKLHHCEVDFLSLKLSRYVQEQKWTTKKFTAEWSWRCLEFFIEFRDKFGANIYVVNLFCIGRNCKIILIVLNLVFSWRKSNEFSTCQFSIFYVWRLTSNKLFSERYINADDVKVTFSEKLGSKGVKENKSIEKNFDKCEKN